jgi:hypothetical protein
MLRNTKANKQAHIVYTRALQCTTDTYNAAGACVKLKIDYQERECRHHSSVCVYNAHFVLCWWLLMTLLSRVRC